MHYVLTVWAWGEEHEFKVNDEHGDVEERIEEILDVYYDTEDGWALTMDDVVEVAA